MTQRITLPAPVGNEYMTATLVNGIVSYANTTHQTVTAQTLGLQTIRAAWVTGLAVDGSYYAYTTAVVNGASSIVVRWYAVGGSTEANSVDLSTKQIIIVAIGN